MLGYVSSDPSRIMMEMFIFGSGIYFLLSWMLSGLDDWVVELFWRYIPIVALIASIVMIALGMFGYIPGAFAVNAIWPMGCAVLMLSLLYEGERTHSHLA